MLKAVVVIVGALIRLMTFGIGAVLEYFGVKLLLTGEADTIPFIRVTPQSIEGRELPISVFLCVIGLALMALAVLMRGRVSNLSGFVDHINIGRFPTRKS